MKTAVEAIFVGKARQYNRRFLQMCFTSLWLSQLPARPASGWEKGQVENQVGNLRDQLFRPKPRVSSLAELNGWLADQCIAYARRHKHPEFKDRTIWEVFQEEQASSNGITRTIRWFCRKGRQGYHHVPDHGRP